MCGLRDGFYDGTSNIRVLRLCPSDLTLQELYEFNGKLLRGKQLGLLIVILPDDRIYDEKVEEVCKQLGFTYHCFSPQDAMMPRQEYLALHRR